MSVPAGDHQMLHHTHTQIKHNIGIKTPQKAGFFTKGTCKTHVDIH